MGRPIGMKNNMRTPEQKEKIVIEKLNGATDKQLCSKYNISRSTIFEWLKNYRENGIKGLESQTGKCAKSGNRGRPKNTRTREEELERENLKLRIEIERLKKGYYVKGVGPRKEYISINNRNSESSKN